MNRSTHLKGIAVSTAGVIAISPDSLLIRLIDADVWTLSLWRGLLLASTLAVVQLVRHRGRVFDGYAAMGSRGLLAGLLSGIGTICFVSAITYTTVANVLILLGGTPLVAALMGRVFLGEVVPARTWVAIGGALTGIVVTVGGAVAGPQAGDLFALGTVLCMAGYFTTVRAASAVDMTPCIVISGLVAALLALPFAHSGDLVATQIPYLVLLCALVIPLSFSLLTLGPRYLPAHEVALIGLLEAVLGPYLVWLVLDEHPGAAALVGGAIVLAVLSAHSVIGLRTDNSDGDQAPAAVA